MAYILLFITICVVCVQSQDNQIAIGAIENLIEEKREGGNLPLLGGLVRLAFHDCVGDGGCDGCIDHDNPDNAGLKHYTHALDEVYGKTFPNKEMSRADFYALAALIALDKALGRRSTRFISLFKAGRLDCSSSPKENRKGKFPKASDGLDLTLNFFKNTFGFTAKETTALLGAHTLGRANLANSGYDGPWVRNNGPRQVDATSVLNNAFYKALLNPWRQVQVPNPDETAVKKFHWKNGGDNMMLNSDMCLSWDFTVCTGDQASCTRVPHVVPKEFPVKKEPRRPRHRRPPPGGRKPPTGSPPPPVPTCPVTGSQPPRRAPPCPASLKSFTAKFVEEYANDNDKWLNDFSAVFLKMINSRGETRSKRDELMDAINDINSELKEIEALLP